MTSYSASKRLIDVGGAALVLALAAPLCLLAAVAILANSGRPVLYRARRLGRHETEFDMYKFRTMRVGADAQGPGITAGGDPRITQVGAILRRWKLDELPQLLNVLRGDMSLVGPRPEDPRYLPLYSSAQRAVLTAKPGITGPTQIAFRHEERLLAGQDVERAYQTRLLPRKLEMDLAYVRRQSLATDLMLLIRTFLSLFAGLTGTVDPAVTSGPGESR